MSAVDSSLVQHTLRVTLKGKDNSTYSGTLLIRNWTAVEPPAPEPDEGYISPQDDPTGASYYVIAVVLVYGFSIVMLIASHIKRKHAKQIEDKQINKYLQEFQIVKEKSSRDSYRHLKKSIVAKLGKERRPTYRTLSTTLFPVMAVALPPIQEQQDGQHQHRNSLQVPSEYQGMGMRPRGSGGSISTSSMYEYISRGSRAPSLAELNARARHMSLSIPNSREGSIDRFIGRPGISNNSLSSSGGIEIEVPVYPAQPPPSTVSGTWRNVHVDIIPELHESPTSEELRAVVSSSSQPDRPQELRPDRLQELRPDRPQELRPDRLQELRPDRLQELRPDRLQVVAEQVMAHRVQTHPPPPSPSLRRTATAPLARVSAATSPRAQAHMSGRQSSNGPRGPVEGRDGEDGQADLPRVHSSGRHSRLDQHEQADRSRTVSPRHTPDRGPSPRGRMLSTITSERSASPCGSVSSDDQEQENVWLLIENGSESSPQSASSPKGLGFEGAGSRGSVSPLIKSSRDTSPLNSREGSHSRSTTPSRLSTPSRSLSRSNSQRRSSSPRPGSRHSLPLGRRRSPSPRASPRHPRTASPSPVSSETEHLLHVTVL